MNGKKNGSVHEQNCPFGLKSLLCSGSNFKFPTENWKCGERLQWNTEQKICSQCILNNPGLECEKCQYLICNFCKPCVPIQDSPSTPAPNYILPATILANTYENSIYIHAISEEKLERCILILKGHENNISCLIQVNQNLLVSASWDKTIKIWDLSLQKCIKTFIGHTDQISCLAKLNDRILISGGHDNLIMMWDIQEGKLISKIEAHQAKVTCLAALDQDFFVSGSEDKQIKIWNFKHQYNKKFPHILENDNEIISSLLILNGKKAFASGGWKGTIKIWDYDGICMISKSAHSFGAMCMTQISENLLVSEGCDLTIKIWKISNDEKFIMELLTTYQEESIAYGLIKLDEGVLASVFCWREIY